MITMHFATRNAATRVTVLKSNSRPHTEVGQPKNVIVFIALYQTN